MNAYLCMAHTPSRLAGQFFRYQIPPSTSAPIGGLHAEEGLFDLDLLGPSQHEHGDLDHTSDPEEAPSIVMGSNILPQEAADMGVGSSDNSQRRGTKRKAAAEDESSSELMPYMDDDDIWWLPCSCVDRMTGEKPSFKSEKDARRHLKTTKEHVQGRLCSYGCGTFFKCPRKDAIIRHNRSCPGFLRQQAVNSDSEVTIPPKTRKSRKKRERRR
jgi:hypothetical protein